MHDHAMKCHVPKEKKSWGHIEVRRKKENERTVRSASSYFKINNFDRDLG